MTEKATLSEDEHDQRQPAAACDKSSELNDVSEQNPNGGLRAWLSVLAGFCVFVNSWLVKLDFCQLSANKWL
jgi:hypothetical protein